MADFRQQKSKQFRKPLIERGDPHGGHGRRASEDIAEQFETQTGHPLGERGASPRAGGVGDKRSRGGIERGQHARTGQAESPRELTINQPEKKRRGNRNG